MYQNGIVLSMEQMMYDMVYEKIYIKTLYV